MRLHTIDPLSDHRWDEFVSHHPKSSIFHEGGWLRALSATYGYQPLVLTTDSSGQALSEGIVLCRVSSWITGVRLVSLPFADHCEPLCQNAEACCQFIDWLRTTCDHENFKYIEIRTQSCFDGNDRKYAGAQYYLHTLDLNPSLEVIFEKFHRDSIQRRIRRAEREQLQYETGRSDKLIGEFYRLLVMTRKRHGVLPQPQTWFRNLVEYLRENVQIRVVRKEGIPIAAMLTLRHGSTVVFKYGCSNERYHCLGGIPWLFWRVIEESKADRAEVLDFGRSDKDGLGLVTFKDRFGTTRKQITYSRYPRPIPAVASATARSMKRIISVLPNIALSVTGGLVYKHMG